MVKANHALNNSAQFVIVCFMVAHNCHGKTKNLTAKTKYLTAKPKTSNSFGFAARYIYCLCREVLGFVVRYVRYFVFAVRFSVLP